MATAPWSSVQFNSEGTNAIGTIVDGIGAPVGMVGRVVVGKTGVIEGEVECESADVEGTLNATVEVSGMLEMKATATINGNLTVGKLNVEPGAAINGKIDMGGTIKSISNEKIEKVVEKTA